MPVISTQPVPVQEPSIVYERLAFRCSLSAQATEAGVESGTCAVHATKYRKLTDGDTTYLDVLGLQGQNEVGAVATYGQSPEDTALIDSMTAIATGYAGVTGAVSLNFSWRAEAGDIVGMVHLTIGEYSKACGNSNDLEAIDPAFAQAFAAIINALSVWCQARGW